MDALQEIIEREATEGIESVSWLEVTIHGAYWRKRHEPAHPGLVEAAQELAQLQAIATAVREVVDGQPLGDTAPDNFIANFRIRLGAIRKLSAALAALEQETK